MQPPSLSFVAQTIVIRTLVCSPTDSKERKQLLETLKTTKGTCLSEELLLLVAELFPRELTDELLCVLAPEYLRQLKLNNCSSLTWDGVVKTITKCNHLTYIDFSCCENLLRPAIYCCLKDNAPNITHLSFEDCEVMTDDGVQIILMCCPGLEHLNISSCNNISDKAFAMSSTLPPNKSSKSSPKLSQRALLGGKNLSSIDLSGCQSLTNATIKNLVALCGPTLTSINISWTRLGCIALLYLAGLSPKAAIQFVQEVDSSCVEALSSLTDDEGSVSGNNDGEDLDQEDQRMSVESNKADGQSSCLEKDRHEEKRNVQNVSDEAVSLVEKSTENIQNTCNDIAKPITNDENKIIIKEGDLRSSPPAESSTNGTNTTNLDMKDSTSSERSNFEEADPVAKSEENSEIEKTKASNLESTTCFIKVDEKSKVSNAEDVKHYLSGSEKNGKNVENKKMGTDIDSTENFKVIEGKCEGSDAGEDEYYLSESGEKLGGKKDAEASNIVQGQSTEFENSIHVNCQSKNGKKRFQENFSPKSEKREIEITKLKKENSENKNDDLDVSKMQRKSEIDLQGDHVDVPSKSLSFPTVGLPVPSTSTTDSHRPPYSSMQALEEDWMLAWQQVGDEDSCSDNDELFDSMWGDVHQSSHVDSVSSVFGDAISCLTSALVHLESTDDDDDDDTKILQQTRISTSYADSCDGDEERDDDDDVQSDVDADNACGGGDDDDDTKLLQHTSISTSHVTSCDGGGGDDDDVQGNGDADNACGGGDDDDATKAVQQTSISTSHVVTSCDGNDGGGDVAAADDDGDNKGITDYVGGEDNGGDDVDDGGDDDDDGVGDGSNESVNDGGDENHENGDAEIIVPPNNIGESAGNVSSSRVIDNCDQEESLDDADDLFTDMLNLQEWRTEDSSSLLHGFNDALVSLTNAMFELMDSDDDDDDDNDDDDGDAVDGDGDDDGGGDGGDGDDTADADAADGNDDGAVDDDGDNDTCRVDSLNHVTLEQINLVMLSQDNNETNPDISDGKSGSVSVQNHIVDIQDFEKQNILNFSTKEPFQQPNDKVTDPNVLDGNNSAVSMSSSSSILTQGSKDENVILHTKSDILAREFSCEDPSDVGEKTVEHEGRPKEGLENGRLESSKVSSQKTKVSSTYSSKDDNLTIPYVTECSKKGKEPLVLTLTYKPRLRSLDITNINFHSKALGVACLKLFFSVNTTLKSFAVSWSELDDDTLVAMVTNQPELHSLTLTDCEKVRDPSLLSLPVHCPLLESIDLRGVAFVTDLGVVPMLDCPRLKTLSLAETSVTDITMFALAKKCGEKLRDLDLSWCEELTDKGRCAMAESCTGLESLALRQCTASRITMETLSIYCQSMTSLNVSSVGQLTDQVVVTMVTNMPNLTFVDMSWNSDITSKGVGALLSHCGKLEEAVLSGLKALTTKPFFGIIGDLPRWRTKQDIMLRRKLKSKQNGGPIETYIKPCDMETAKSLGEELPFRSTTYSPVLRNLVLEYSDMVNDEHLSQIVAVCRGTLNIRDYYGQPIEPMWIFL